MSSPPHLFELKVCKTLAVRQKKSFTEILIGLLSPLVESDFHFPPFAVDQKKNSQDVSWPANDA